MNKILFLISTIALAACSANTVKNDWTSSVKVGETVVASGACEQFSDGFFGFGSDWPQTITTESGEATTADGDKEKQWEANNYIVNVAGSIEESEEACETTEEEEETEAPATEEEEEAPATEEPATEAPATEEEAPATEEPATEETE